MGVAAKAMYDPSRRREPPRRTIPKSMRWRTMRYGNSEPPDAPGRDRYRTHLDRSGTRREGLPGRTRPFVRGRHLAIAELA